MPHLTFIDTEIDPTSKKILDIGAVRNDRASFHSASLAEFVRFLNGTEWICGITFSITLLSIPARRLRNHQMIF